MHDPSPSSTSSADSGPDADHGDPTPAFVSYCGVTFAPAAIGARTPEGRIVAIPRIKIKGLAVRALRSRKRAIRYTTLAAFGFAFAAMVALNALGVIDLFRGTIFGDLGFQAAMLIGLVGAAIPLMAHAWDPKHVLVVTTYNGQFAFELVPTPDPSRLITILDEAHHRFGYEVDLYPD